jgi:hypothetical protein
MVCGGSEGSQEASKNASKSRDEREREGETAERTSQAAQAERAPEAGRPSAHGPTAEPVRTGAAPEQETEPGVAGGSAQGRPGGRRDGGGGGGGGGGDEEPGQQKITVLYTNAQSLQGKLNELNAVLIDLKPDIVLLCETWCNAGTDAAFLNIDGYTFQSDLRLDRNDTANGIGGGLAVYTVNGLDILACDRVVDFNQYCKFKLELKNESLYFYLVYRLPSGGKQCVNWRFQSTRYRLDFRHSRQQAQQLAAGGSWRGRAAPVGGVPHTHTWQHTRPRPHQHAGQNRQY